MSYTLTPERMKFALIESVEMLIEFEEVSFSDNRPYWSNTGDNIDGTEQVEED